TESYDPRPLPFQVADHAKALDAAGCGAVERNTVEDDVSLRTLLRGGHRYTRRCCRRREHKARHDDAEDECAWLEHHRNVYAAAVESVTRGEPSGRSAPG